MWRDSKTLFHNAIPHISLSIEIVFVETGTNIFAEVTVTGCLFVAPFSDRQRLRVTRSLPTNDVLVYVPV